MRGWLERLDDRTDEAKAAALNYSHILHNADTVNPATLLLAATASATAEAAVLGGLRLLSQGTVLCGTVDALARSHTLTLPSAGEPVACAGLVARLSGRVRVAQQGPAIPPTPSRVRCACRPSLHINTTQHAQQQPRTTDAAQTLRPALLTLELLVGALQEQTWDVLPALQALYSALRCGAQYRSRGIVIAAHSTATQCTG